jgi:hypothetical protein
MRLVVLGALLYVMLGIAPSAANAFIGESLVINPVTKDLTEVAKTIIEKPTFLTENIGEAAAQGGAAEASGAAGVFEGAGVVPGLGGGLLAFGVGAGIGTEICHVFGIAGCWDFYSQSADPKVGGGIWETEGNYVFFEKSPPVTGGPKWSWYWHFNNSLYEVDLEGYTGLKKPPEGCHHYQSPGGADVFHAGQFVKNICEPKAGVHEDGTEYYVTRYSMNNRAIKYDATDDPSISNYKPGGKDYGPPVNWSEKFASEIEGHTGDPAAKVGERIATEVKGSGVKNPYATVKVPSCEGLKISACTALVEELKLKPEVTELDWEDAVIEELDELEPEKTREKESERVITVLPSPGEFVVPGTDVEIEANPDKEDMPEFVPKPDPGEDEDEFEKRKLILPIWLPKAVELDDGTLDPEKGPNEVVRTHPHAGTRVDPHASPGSVEVESQYNPSDAPEPSGVPWTPPTVPGIDTGPLTGMSTPCTVFPFGLFCWVATAFGQFNTTPQCPEASIPIYTTHMHLSLCSKYTETFMTWLRDAILLGFTVGCGYLFARGTRAIGDD